MARIVVDADAVVVRLTPLERLSSGYFGPTPRVQRSAVVGVEVVQKPTQGRLAELAQASWLADLGSPNRLLNVDPWAHSWDGRRACVIARRWRPAVLVNMSAESAWAMFVISCRDADELVERLKREQRRAAT